VSVETQNLFVECQWQRHLSEVVYCVRDKLRAGPQKSGGWRGSRLSLQWYVCVGRGLFVSGIRGPFFVRWM